MVGLDAALIGLGSSVIKSACTIWMGESQPVAAASGSLVELLAKRVTGVMEQRRLARQLDQLVDAVAERLLTLLRHEFTRLPDFEREAAVEAVRETFGSAVLTDDVLFGSDLDPVYLDRVLRGMTPELVRRAGLSGDGEALYDLLLRESCAYVVEIATTLPRFEAGTLVEILRRETAILASVQDVVARLPERRSLGDIGFEADYRRQVVNKLDRLELFGVTLSEASRRYPLSVAYVSLSATSSSDVKMSAQSIGPQGFELSGLAEQPGPSIGDALVEQVLAGSRRLLLRGGAGSGKTTLLQWLAVSAALRRFSAELSGWNGLVPFFIPLRRYVGSVFPPPQRFLDQVGRHIAVEMPKGWVHALLRDGRALVLVDGLDELPERRRADARHWLRDLTMTFPDARYVMTSRPSAAPDGWLREGFTEADLLPLTPVGVRAFMRKWHNAVRADTLSADEHTETDTETQALAEVVLNHRHLRALATNPLLCALLCALYRDRRTRLPRDRFELYRIALEMLLDRRDIEREVDVGPPLSRIQKVLMLQDLAYWLVRNGQLDIEVRRASGLLASRLAALGLSETHPDAFLEHLVLRSGVIRESVVGHIDFVHRTFQEYLAALAAVQADDIPLLIRNAHLDRWRDVIVLAVGHAQPRQRTELLTGLIDRGNAEPAQRARLHVLATACLANAPELDPVVRQEVERCTHALLPPPTMAAARSLAAAGDTVVELLADLEIRPSRHVAAAIRAAADVRTPAALNLIAQFGSDPRQAVVAELLRAWPRYDAVEYASTVLADSPLHGGHLNLRDPQLVPGLPCLRHLRSLRCEFALPSEGLAFTQRLTGLVDLDLSGTPTIPPLVDLAHHPSLQGLDLGHYQTLPDLEPLGQLPTLRWLMLWECGPFDDYMSLTGPLTRLPRLENISFTDVDDRWLCQQLLPALPALTQLGLRQRREPIPIANLTKALGDHPMAGLFLFGGGLPDDLDALSCWADTLTALNVADSPIQDLHPLQSLHQLEFLNLAHTPVTDLTPLRGLAHLKTLLLHHMVHTVDLTPLAGMNGLTIYVDMRRQITGVEKLGEGIKVKHWTTWKT